MNLENFPDIQSIEDFNKLTPDEQKDYIADYVEAKIPSPMTGAESIAHINSQDEMLAKAVANPSMMFVVSRPIPIEIYAKLTKGEILAIAGHKCFEDLFKLPTNQQKTVARKLKQGYEIRNRWTNLFESQWASFPNNPDSSIPWNVWSVPSLSPDNNLVGIAPVTMHKVTRLGNHSGMSRVLASG